MRTWTLLAAVAVTTGLAGCGADDPPRTALQARAVPTATPAAEIEGELGRPVTVPGTANIFGAGRERPPAPSGGGAGVLPARWLLPGTTTPRAVTFPRITGTVSPIDPSMDNGPGGDRIGPTDVRSYRGISGIRHRHNGMFLVGVFLPDVELLDHAPRRLDFTNRDRFQSLAPRIGQTFLIGDGKGRSYDVPPGATRLYVGFADGYLYVGKPGWYDNNGGELSVTVKLAQLRST
jgi:hypothetical protein